MSCECPGLGADISMDVGAPAQGVLQPLTAVPGGAYVFFRGDDGKCSGWAQIMGRGVGGSQWFAGKTVSPLVVPASVACAWATQINRSPFTPIELDIKNAGWVSRVRLNKPWVAPKKTFRGLIFGAMTPFFR